MREVKFRGKRVDNGEWAEGDLVRHYENQRRFIVLDQMAFTYSSCGIGRLVSERYCEVDPNTVGQYTGFKDQDGWDIYEGDIVSYIDCSSTENGNIEINCVGVVEWDEETASFIVTERLSAESYEVLNDGCEVIGNIHKHKHLLGGK